MSIFVGLARPVLILVFLVAGVTKLSRPAGFRQTCASLGVPPQLQAPAVFGLLLAELTVACLLVWPATAVLGALFVSLLALLFISVVIFALATRRTVPCSCFGNLGRSALGKATLARDLVLLAVSGALLEAFLTDRKLRHWLSPVNLSHLSISAWLAISFAGLTLIVVIYAGWLIAALVRQNARLLRQLASDAATTRQDARDAMPIGSPAPSLKLIGNESDDIPAVLAGFRTLLIFVDQACRACIDLSPEIASWQKALALTGGRTARRAQIVVFAEPAKAAHGPEVFESMSVLRDTSGQVASRYGVTASPVALIIDEYERIASRMASGPDEIRHLHFHFWESITSSGAVELEPTHGREILR